MTDEQPLNVGTIEVFYGISSPWAYLGMPKLREIARSEGVSLTLRPIRIIQNNGGIPLRERPLARQNYHVVELTRWRKFLDIPLNLKPKYYPCRTIEYAACLVIAAGLRGHDDVALSWAIQSALWAHDQDIADTNTLENIVGSVLHGDAKELLAFSQTSEVYAVWEKNLFDAEQLGIFGTPTYVVGDELFWGQDRLDFVQRKIHARC
ncbi:2-hydroxychromene-2-carboxylate isomerase [Gluconobacter wancherniae]|uniref:2-hydroxychromene-2-carboxylate isomerase n=1 Tax=Gluconobacter wancherniae NBRC 103581 TaxID=656744 RepID=A0A511AXS9_9PROT|nr:2-hydroxychromene-2-carboxylate isomerase [Gluconobacter wancherniae]MBF0853200.1 2-hydroxychromene-2-carboxylate isomerase [Gluconobacter wancherniae]GBD56081.1 2-hydroxychromene-2-carboxylate isomerase [Gluconobacter wancherniae NBRC 103581]GBR63158.1 2-hydroxychromene-2-carboxylate isomerase [Gluconobacter wancherniae NBRC 103581]GEK93018.1 2-hydroxychromene-2-carboxylate isomerase [Gluconobacter wancherniae NBRC 103581]